MAEPIDLPFGLWTRVEGSTSTTKHKFSHIRQVVRMCPDRRAHWHHLANTIEPFVCGDDAVLCEVTLTTCYCWYQERREHGGSEHTVV